MNHFESYWNILFHNFDNFLRILKSQLIDIAIHRVKMSLKNCFKNGKTYLS